VVVKVVVDPALAQRALDRAVALPVTEVPCPKCPVLKIRAGARARPPEYRSRTPLVIGGSVAASGAVADLNGDGKPDIVCIGSATANLKWYENRN
jgi:hypothetical protein